MSVTTQYGHNVAEEIRAEEAVAANVRRLAAEIAAAAEPIWHWGDGAGGGVKHILYEAFEAAGLPTSPPVYGGKKPKAKAKIPAPLRTAVYERDGYACVVCGIRRDLTLDHIVPEALGGPTTFENLQTMCRPHNTAKGVRV